MCHRTKSYETTLTANIRLVQLSTNIQISHGFRCRGRQSKVYYRVHSLSRTVTIADGRRRVLRPEVPTAYLGASLFGKTLCTTSTQEHLERCVVLS